jgi:putative flavoprotein involved in K+ transport
LVIGSGNSGVQIAEELCSAGRRVYLSVSKHRRIPRRYRGRDYSWWYLALGDGETTIDQQPSALPARLLTGVRGGHDLDLHRLAADGIVLLGRILDGRGGKLAISSDLGENLARGDASFIDFTQQADEHAAQQGLDLPLSDERAEVMRKPAEVTDPILTLDLAAADISTIIWAKRVPV